MKPNRDVRSEVSFRIPSFSIPGADGDIVVRPMRDEPEEWSRYVAWRNEPHVREFWDPDEGPETIESALEEYGAEVRGEGDTHVCIIEAGGGPIGFVQAYPWGPYVDYLAESGIEVPEHAWGSDIFIGAPSQVGKGIGRLVIRALADHLFEHHGASQLAFGVEMDNERARRMYLAAGMTPVKEYLDTDERDGKRVTCVWLVRDR